MLEMIGEQLATHVNAFDVLPNHFAIANRYDMRVGVADIDDDETLWGHVVFIAEHSAIWNKRCSYMIR